MIYAAILFLGNIQCGGTATTNEGGSETLTIKSECVITMEECLYEAEVRTADGKVHTVLGCGTSRVGGWEVDFE